MYEKTRKIKNQWCVFCVKKTVLEYSIDTSEKYDDAKGNKEIEKIKKISLDNIQSLDDFIVILSDKIIEIKDTIVKFYDFGSKMN